jgi:HEAT repeat protein
VGDGRNTAEELLTELERDPEWVAERDARENLLERQRQDWRDAERPLTEALRQLGFEVDSAWDLVGRTAPYPEALPILLEHLSRPYPDRVREGIARALAVRGDARFAWDELRRLYEAEPPETDAKQGLAAALSAICDKTLVDDLAALAKDPKQGPTRILFVRAFRRLRAIAIVDELAADPQFSAEIEHLRRQGSRST